MTTETEADSGTYPELRQCAEPNPADYLTVGDPVLTSMRLASTGITLDNAIIVAAGGLWAAHLEPAAPPNDCLYNAPALTIRGSVITGHAGVTSRWEDCDGDVLNGQETIVAGYDRTSSLPTNTAAWATANIAWWPDRDQGVWRRR